MEQPLAYHIIRTKRRKKTLSLCIEKDGSVVIRVPLRMPTPVIESFFNAKKRWIVKKLTQRSARQKEQEPKKFVSGESFFYLGGRYRLKITEQTGEQTPLVFTDDVFYLDERRQTEARDLFVAWYKEQAEVKVRERLQFYRQHMELSPRRERITSATRQWGGCSSRDALTFSWRLVMAPLFVIDYIVVHELAHIREKNHSPRFWKIVEATLPDYRLRRDWLRQYGYQLNL
jgi:predicted metal-dependent hydrolase